MSRSPLPALSLAAALCCSASALAAQPLAGFPKRVPGAAAGKDPALVSTAVALDASDGGRAIFGAGSDLHCFSFAGQSCDGFPFRIGERVGFVGAPAVGDVDGDKRPEIAVSTSDGKVVVVRADGTELPGFSLPAGGLEAGPSLIDLDGDGRLEVVVGAKGGKLHAVGASGSPLPGFPVSLPSTITSAVSAGQIGASPKPALASGNEDGKVYLTDVAGRTIPGFPVSSSYLVSGQPALGDLDGDGANDLAFGSQDFKVYAARPDGKPFPGFPVAVGARVIAGPALGDLEGEGRLEIAVAAIDGRLHAFDLDGKVVKGFPVKLGDKLVGAPVIADLDRDGKEEILATTSDGQLHALRGNGKPFAGFPAKLGAEAASGPAVIEWGEGTAIFQGAGDKVHAFRVKRAGKSAAPLAWREQGHDSARTGRVHPNPPGYADLRITPANPTTEDALTAEYRYFDLDGDPEPATEIRWIRDGKEVADLVGKRSVPKEATQKREKWRFQISAPGGTPRQSGEVTIANSKPGRAKVAFEPENPRRADPVKVRILEDAPDVDGDKPVYSYAWLKDGQPQKGLNKAEVPAGTVRRGERWAVVVVASDGELEGPPANAEATVADSPPTVPEIALSPAQPKAGDPIKVVVQKPATDVDGDALKYRYRYYVDGVPLPLASSLDTLPAFSARKAQIVGVEVQADDGVLQGPAAKAQAALANTPPTAPKPSIVPREPRTGETLVGGLEAASSDVDGDKLTYRFSFSRNGQKAPDGREVGGLKKDETIELTAVANDGEADSPPARVTVAVKNTPPTAPTLAFEAVPLRRSEAVRAKIAVPASDADGDPISYRWAWFKDGQPQAGLTSPELPAGTVRKGEHWRAVATPNDGKVDGTPGAVEARAADSAPGGLEVTLTPTTPRVGDPIRAVVSKPASDVDGDPVKYLYRFTIDGTPAPLEASVDTLSARSARKKQAVAVEVRADDGELQGPVASARVVVQNTAPEAPRAAILPVEPRAGEVLLGAIDRPATDADGDPLAYRFTFKKDGRKVDALADGREVRGLKKGETYELEVVANDGEADSPPAKASVAVRNVPPIAPALAFEALPLRRAEAVKVKVATPSTDVDGDAITYRWAWLKDGQPQAGLTTPDLPAGTVRKGEKWRVVATPNDGQADGAPGSLEAVVADSAPSGLEISLAPAAPRVGDAIRAVVQKPASDVDGDALKYKYRFLIDGAPAALEPSVDTLPARTARKKQVVSVEVRADDGEMQGPVATAKLTVLNTPPEAPQAALLPAEPRAGEVLLGAVEKPATDADGDALTYRFAFKRDGKKDAAADGREVRGVKKGEVCELEIVASDGEADSPVARTAVTVRNARPTAPAISFANAAPAAGEAVDLRIDRASTDPDGDSVTYAFTWTVDGKPAGLPKDARAIPAGRLKKHEAWVVEATPSDGQEPGPSGKARLVAVNTPPTAPAISIEPAEPTAESGAKARLDKPSTDRDGDALKYRYSWFKDGVRLEVEAASLAPGTIKRGESLKVTVTPFDGEVEGPAGTAAARVKNSAPTAPQVVLEPERPTVRAALACVVKVASKDPDKETPVLRYAWRRDGEVVALSADQDRLPAGMARHGEAWACEVVATDGEISSAPARAQATIANSPPGSPELVVEPENPKAGEALQCRLVQPAEDADGDAVTYAFQWKAGGKPISSDPAQPWVLPAAATKKGQAYTCEVSASDAQAKGPVAAAEAKYRNSAPTSPGVKLSPEAATPGTSLACEVSRPSVDPDGDPVRYVFLWQKNGVEQSFAASSAEVPGRLVKAGDIWRCSVVPSDGDNTGPAGASNEVVVQPTPASAGR